MKILRVIWPCALLSLIMDGFAQVPYFASTPGNNNLYGYISVKFRPRTNAQESYTTLQYGIGQCFAIGADITTSVSNAYFGISARFGYMISKYFNIGIQVTPSFNLSDGFGFGYLSTALYMNGSIAFNDRLFWVANTWYTHNCNSSYSIEQWAYLGYNINLTENNSITPLIGVIYSWQFNDKPDLSIGAYWTHNNYNFYLWLDDAFRQFQRIVIGIDFKF